MFVGNIQFVMNAKKDIKYLKKDNCMKIMLLKKWKYGTINKMGDNLFLMRRNL